MISSKQSLWWNYELIKIKHENYMHRFFWYICWCRRMYVYVVGWVGKQND